MHVYLFVLNGISARSKAFYPGLRKYWVRFGLLLHLHVCVFVLNGISAGSKALYRYHPWYRRWEVIAAAATTVTNGNFIYNWNIFTQLWKHRYHPTALLWIKETSTWG